MCISSPCAFTLCHRKELGKLEAASKQDPKGDEQQQQQEDEEADQPSQQSDDDRLYYYKAVELKRLLSKKLNDPRVLATLIPVLTNYDYNADGKHLDGFPRNVVAGVHDWYGQSRTSLQSHMRMEGLNEHCALALDGWQKRRLNL